MPEQEGGSSLAARLAKTCLGIDVHERSHHEPRNLAERAAQGVYPAQPYFEDDPTVKEWLLDHRPTVPGTVRYVKSLFPFTDWIFRYNLQWLAGDLIGGVTLGFVVVPQAMAYALLAQLSPQYGLYTSFTGAVLYWLFGTSKDIAIGATAVVSLLVGRILSRVGPEHPDIPPDQIAKTISVMSGIILLAFGLLRLDWIIEFIPHVAIAAFVTGASITITLSQAPAMLGIKGIDTRQAPWKVCVDTLGALDRCTLDAAVGLTALALLHLIKWYCGRMAARQKHRQRLWDTLSSVRMTFVILLYTLISFLVNRSTPLESVKFRILGPVPTGFQAAGPPSFDPKLIRALAPDLPAVLIILIIEHIAIGKSFARINDYVVVPSQEIISIGATNFLGPFLGAYPSTGSFTGTAVLSKAGVRTPLAGVYNALILLLALYALTSVFYYIPMASLAGLIIHAVGNLVTRPAALHRYWLVSPLEVFIFFAGVFISVFESLEIGIYCTVALSLALLLLRVARTRGRFLGRVRVRRHGGGSGSACEADAGSAFDKTDEACDNEDHDEHSASLSAERVAFLPLDRLDGSNPAIDVEAPYPGVFIYRFSEGYNYLNQAQHTDTLTSHIRAHTRPAVANRYDLRPGDRPWNEPVPRRSQTDRVACLPELRAVVLDCSAVDGVDMTAWEGLVDMRAQLGRWAAPGVVEWHLAAVGNRWTRRALAAGGFGFPSGRDAEGEEWRAWRPVCGVAEMMAEGGGAGPVPRRAVVDEEMGVGRGTTREGDGHRAGAVTSGTLTPVGGGGGGGGGEGSGEGEKKNDPDAELVTAAVRRKTEVPLEKMGAVFGVDRPFFHLDLASAVGAAVSGVKMRERRAAVAAMPACGHVGSESDTEHEGGDEHLQRRQHRGDEETRTVGEQVEVRVKDS